jgi:hypothetical protein
MAILKGDSQPRHGPCSNPHRPCIGLKIVYKRILKEYN